MRDGAHSSEPGGTAGRSALLGLCALEAALVLVAIGWQKAAAPGDMLPPGTAGNTLLAGSLLAVIVVVVLARVYARCDAAGRRAFAMGAIGNVLGVVLALAGAEALLRLTLASSREGRSLGRLTLPLTWEEIRARNAEVIASAAAVRDQWPHYIVSDPYLGWTVGRNRRTPDGMYFSSVEGVRSGRPDVSYAGHRPALRIALVGDSFAFAMDVPFEESWGWQLEQRLGGQVEVLNFGVEGYGIDQAWLRYERDVAPWHPDIVLFGVIQHDMVRTVAVYPFITFRWDYPYAKPRFAVAGAGLELLNVPLIDAASILARTDVDDLPFAAYDRGYQETDWRWLRGNPPLIARLFGTAFRRFPADTAAVSDEAAVGISGRLLQRFLRQAAADGAAARIVYFPTEGAGDFGKTIPDRARIARQMLSGYALDHLDLTSCILSVPAESRLVPRRVHYTRQANARVAECVAADLAAMGRLTTLPQPDGQASTRPRVSTTQGMNARPSSGMNPT